MDFSSTRLNLPRCPSTSFPPPEKLGTSCSPRSPHDTRHWWAGSLFCGHDGPLWGMEGHNAGGKAINRHGQRPTLGLLKFLLVSAVLVTSRELTDRKYHAKTPATPTTRSFRSSRSNFLATVPLSYTRQLPAHSLDPRQPSLTYPHDVVSPGPGLVYSRYDCGSFPWLQILGSPPLCPSDHTTSLQASSQQASQAKLRTSTTQHNASIAAPQATPNRILKPRFIISWALLPPPSIFSLASVKPRSLHLAHIRPPLFKAHKL